MSDAPVNKTFWDFFGLTYNHYLTVPRSLLQSMPEDWQTKMVGLLEEMMATPAGQVFATHHYLVRRTDPQRDVEISEAEWEKEAKENAGDDEPVEIPEPKFIDDPFYNYRHPSSDIPWGKPPLPRPSDLFRMACGIGDAMRAAGTHTDQEMPDGPMDRGCSPDTKT